MIMRPKGVYFGPSPVSELSFGTSLANVGQLGVQLHHTDTTSIYICMCHNT